MNIPCFAISVITDLGIEGKIAFVTHQSVQHEAEKTESKMTAVMTELIKGL
jgi:purine-nucleoside phosphorylase